MTGMEIFDTHCHLFMEEFGADLAEVLRRAREAGVTRMVHVGLDLDTSRKALELARGVPGHRAAVGWHPHDARLMAPSDPGRLAALAADPLVVAFGEIGLDFYRDLSPRDTQLKAFRSLLEAACGAGKPVVIHTRAAYGETRAELSAFRDSLAGILIHCFTGSPSEAAGFLELGCFLSFPGTLTYKNAAPVREAAALAPRDRIMIETDSPYLAPVPKRSRRNEPAYLAYLVEELGKVLGITASEAAALTTANALRFFGLESAAGESPAAPPAAGQGGAR
ncbi:MAG: TatD family hydrolase [Deltaproteobacteria bacterium]|jgi:TatD DNase family protein|nr:TatD family hydrolase [Deltaproteobacteria bacterium]